MIGADAKILQQMYEDESRVVAVRKRSELGAVVLAVERLSQAGRVQRYLVYAAQRRDSWAVRLYGRRADPAGALPVWRRAARRGQDHCWMAGR